MNANSLERTKNHLFNNFILYQSILILRHTNFVPKRSKELFMTGSACDADLRSKT